MKHALPIIDLFFLLLLLVASFEFKPRQKNFIMQIFEPPL